MKTKKLLTLVIIILLSVNSFSQVAINSDGSTPDGSAILDLKSSDKGLLIPRISLTGTSDNTTISSPATGLMIYNTSTTSDVLPGFYFYNGTKWAPVGEAAYTFENGLTESGSHAVGLGGTLSGNTTITFSAGFANNLYYNLNNSSQFIIQNSGTDNVIFKDDGTVDFKGNISSGEYMNFDGTFGSGGYGFREHSGDLQYKRTSSEDWSDFPASVAGTPYWWYRPTSANYIQPQNNGNIRVYDDNTTYGLFFDGGTNQYGGYFRTTGSYSTTAAVVGYSDVSGNETKGYLGYDGTWTSASGDFDIDGMAVFGEVADKGRAAVFGSTTRDATYAAIIGYSDVWIAGYYSILDVSNTSASHPALYGQNLVNTAKSGSQTAVEGWSEYEYGSDNRGYTVGADFTAYGWSQDSKALNLKAKSYGTNTEAYGIDMEVDSADYIYGVKISAGNTTVTSTKCYGVYSQAVSSNGTGILAIGSNASNVFISGKGDGVVGVTDDGYGVFGQLDDGSGNLNTYGVLGYKDTTANYFYHNETTSTDGQSAIYAVRKGTNAGTNYGAWNTNQAIYGYNFAADSFSFAITGQCQSIGKGRTGGVFGSDKYAWGCLGYEISGTHHDYGGYFHSSSSPTTGTGNGKNNNNIIKKATGVGIGSYGDLMGGWIRGDVYGATVKGDRYSLYVDGQTYTNDVIVNLTDVGNNQRVATYVPTASTPTLYMSGIGKLSNGKAIISFDNKYKQLIDENQPVIVTITPIGDCNGLHLTSSKSTGFTVSENAKGASDIKFTWIAIATRKGFNDSDLPKELMDNSFDNKLDGFMFNENNTNASAKPLWWNGSLQTSPIQKDNTTIQTNDNSSNLIKINTNSDTKNQNNSQKQTININKPN